MILHLLCLCACCFWHLLCASFLFYLAISHYWLLLLCCIFSSSCITPTDSLERVQLVIIAVSLPICRAMSWLICHSVLSITLDVPILRGACLVCYVLISLHFAFFLCLSYHNLCYLLDCLTLLSETFGPLSTLLMITLAHL